MMGDYPLQPPHFRSLLKVERSELLHSGTLSLINDLLTTLLPDARNTGRASIRRRHFVADYS